MFKVNSDNKTAAMVYYNGNFENTVVVPSKLDGKNRNRNCGECLQHALDAGERDHSRLRSYGQ